MRKHKLIICLLLLYAAQVAIAQKNTKPKSSKYDFQGAYFEGIAKIKANSKWGFVDSTGNVIVAPKYNQVENFSGGLAKVRIGSKWGLVDKTGAVVIKPTFDWIYDFVGDKAKVKINGEEYYMNKNGQRVPK
jgi:hypothetical protein